MTSNETVVMHIRVPTDMKEQIEERAAKEQRKTADMARVLMLYALTKMPRRDLPVGSMLT